MIIGIIRPIYGDPSGTLLRIDFKDNIQEVGVVLMEVLSYRVNVKINGNLYEGVITNFFGDSHKLTINIDLPDGAPELAALSGKYSEVELLKISPNRIIYAGVDYLNYINGIISKITKLTGNRVSDIEALITNETGVLFSNQRRWLIREANIVREKVEEYAKKYGILIDDSYSGSREYIRRRYKKKLCVICNNIATQHDGALGFCKQHYVEYIKNKAKFLEDNHLD